MHFQGRQWEQDLEKNKLFFLSLRAGGILQILMQSDWFRERAGFHFFLRSCSLNRAESLWHLHSKVCLLFVNEQNRDFKPFFFL